MADFYDQPGTANLRASPSVFGPSAHDTPSGKGDDVGGRENLKAQTKIYTGEKKAPGKGSDNIPALIFNDDVV